MTHSLKNLENRDRIGPELTMSRSSDLLAHVDALRRYWSGVIHSWRHAVQAEPGQLRPEEVMYHFGAPVQVWVHLLRGFSVPLDVAHVLVQHDDARTDGEVLVTIVPEEAGQEPRGDAPRDHIDLDRLRAQWLDMSRNWTSGRAPEPPRLPFWSQRLDRGSSSVFLEIKGDITLIEPGELARSLLGFDRRRDLAPAVPLALPPSVRVDPPTPPAPAESPKPFLHLFELGEDRERVALRRSLENPVFPDDLFSALGLPDACWVALNLPRADIFDDPRLDGDVDLLAGPLEFDTSRITEEGWRERIDHEKRTSPLDTPHGLVRSDAIQRAALNGLLLWPPSIATIAAVEAKASWFDTDARRLKARHSGEGKRVKGQLDVLLDRKVDRVAFLHLVATKPRSSGAGNPWIMAAFDGAEARDTAPSIFDPAERPSCGYFAASLGAVPHKPEDQSGAGRLAIRQPVTTASVPGPPPSWRQKLAARLAKLPRPPILRVFILSCASCKNWSMFAGLTGTMCTTCGSAI